MKFTTHFKYYIQLYTGLYSKAEGWHHWKARDDVPQPFPYLLSHVLPVGQKSDWRLHLKRSSWASFSFSISWTTFPYPYPWPAPSTVSYLQIRSFSTIQIIFYLFLHCHERKKINWFSSWTNSLRPVDSQTEGKRALMKKKKTGLFPEELKSFGGLDVWTKPDPWGKKKWTRGNH